MAAEYQDLIFTNHAEHRLRDRSLRKEAIYQTIHQPTHKQEMDKGEIKFIARYNDRQYHVIATHLQQEDKWLIISNWVRGEEDRVPLSWQLITAPFRLIWYITRQIFQAIFGQKEPRHRD
jgi:hypothetical protein